MAVIYQKKIDEILKENLEHKEKCINMIEKELMKDKEDFEKSVVSIHFGRLVELEVVQQKFLRIMKVFDEHK